MRPDRGGSLALIALVVAALLAGLLTVGGPLQGRAEKRDGVRIDDLLQIRGQVTCLAEAAGGVLPSDLAATDDCDLAERLADPYTGAPYRYARISDTAYRLCAGFETETPRRYAAGTATGFDEGSGCLVVTFRPGG
jgi:hypothetical protein